MASLLLLPYDIPTASAALSMMYNLIIPAYPLSPDLSKLNFDRIEAELTKGISFGSSANFCKNRCFLSPPLGGFGFIGTIYIYPFYK